MFDQVTVPQDMHELAASKDCEVTGILKSGIESPKVGISFRFDEDTNFELYFTTGYFSTWEACLEFNRMVFTLEDFKVNLLKNDKLFPHIKGVMLKDKRMKLHLSSKVNVVELRDGADARAELSFTDRGKTAVVNRTQLLKLVDLYGPETDKWKDLPVVFYGEYGTWFGKSTWGIRIDEDATAKAYKLWKKKNNGKDPKEGQASLIDPEDIPFDDDGAYAE